MGLDSLIGRSLERKSDDLGSIPSRDTDFFLRLTLTVLRVSVTSSHSLINPPRIICFSPYIMIFQVGMVI